MVKKIFVETFLKHTVWHPKKLVLRFHEFVEKKANHTFLIYRNCMISILP